MSAQLQSPTLGTFEPDATLWQWLKATDPVVRRWSAMGLLLGVAVTSVHIGLGIVISALSFAMLAWSKPDALARHHEIEAVEAAIRDLDLRFDEGELDADAYRVRRHWITETARR